MANPLINKGNITSGTVNVPVLEAPPSLQNLIREHGLMLGSQVWDREMVRWTERSNEALSKAFEAIKQNSST